MSYSGEAWMTGVQLKAADARLDEQGGRAAELLDEVVRVPIADHEIPMSCRHFWVQKQEQTFSPHSVAYC